MEALPRLKALTMVRAAAKEDAGGDEGKERCFALPALYGGDVCHATVQEATEMKQQLLAFEHVMEGERRGEPLSKAELLKQVIALSAQLQDLAKQKAASPQPPLIVGAQDTTQTPSQTANGTTTTLPPLPPPPGSAAATAAATAPAPSPSPAPAAPQQKAAPSPAPQGAAGTGTGGAPEAFPDPGEPVDQFEGSPEGSAAGGDEGKQMTIQPLFSMQGQGQQVQGQQGQGQVQAGMGMGNGYMVPPPVRVGKAAEPPMAYQGQMQQQMMLSQQQQMQQQGSGRWGEEGAYQPQMVRPPSRGDVSTATQPTWHLVHTQRRHFSVHIQPRHFLVHIQSRHFLDHIQPRHFLPDAVQRHAHHRVLEHLPGRADTVPAAPSFGRVFECAFSSEWAPLRANSTSAPRTLCIIQPPQLSSTILYHSLWYSSLIQCYSFLSWACVFQLRVPASPRAGGMVPASPRVGMGAFSQSRGMMGQQGMMGPQGMMQGGMMVPASPRVSNMVPASPRIAYNRVPQSPRMGGPMGGPMVPQSPRVGGPMVPQSPRVAMGGPYGGHMGGSGYFQERPMTSPGPSMMHRSPSAGGLPMGAQAYQNNPTPLTASASFGGQSMPPMTPSMGSAGGVPGAFTGHNVPNMNAAELYGGDITANGLSAVRGSLLTFGRAKNLQAKESVLRHLDSMVEHGRVSTDEVVAGEWPSHSNLSVMWSLLSVGCGLHVCPWTG